MNSLQRDNVSVLVGGTVQVSPYASASGASAAAAAGGAEVADLDDAVTISLEINMLARGQVSGKEEDVVAEFKKAFMGQVLCVDMQLAVRACGSALGLKVLSIGVAKGRSSLRGHEAKETSDEILPTRATAGVLVTGTMADAAPNKAAKGLTIERMPNQVASPLLKPNWKFEDMGIGGLDKEFSEVFRRAFASRLYPPATIAGFGVKHVKGMLLYGPPGTGKTLIARQIGKMLSGTEPKIVNGPEVLNKFVGQAEENIRNLFADAERDYAENKDSAGLHIIIFDEIDAICKARGSVRSGTGVHDTMVNQLLTKIDGVDSAPNVLVIGMTNRKDMLDPALLRPGRLEVHVEISLPDEAGRVQIFNIHTRTMRANGHLDASVDIAKLAAMTKNFSGAEIEGVVKDASSYALYGSIDVTKGAAEGKKDLSNVKVTQQHFERALAESKPTFGVSEGDMKTLVGAGLIDHGGPEFQRILDTVATLARNLDSDTRASTRTVLLHGESGAGMTTLAAQLALNSQFPFAKLIAPEMFIGLTETGKAAEIASVFDMAYKSPKSVVLVDNIERLIEYVEEGPRFSNVVLQALLVLFKRPHPYKNKKLLVIATTSEFNRLQRLGAKTAFSMALYVPQITLESQVKAVLKARGVPVSPADADAVAKAATQSPIGIKQLLLVIDMAMQDQSVLTADRFTNSLVDCGIVSHRDF